MIKRLGLTDFGKFRAVSLELGPFTVISGANEAGKTTIFDGLFQALCKHNGVKSCWKNLQERYGEARQAVPFWEPPDSMLQFDDAEFLEIFAIRAGDTSVRAATADQKKGSSWAAAAENALLNAGLNPAKIAEDLYAETTAKGKASLNARAGQVKNAMAKCEAELAQFKAKRDAILAGEADTARLAADKAERTRALAALNADLTQKRAEVETLEAACRLAKALAGINQLREFKRLKEETAKLSMYERSEIAGYRVLLGAKAEAEARVKATEAAIHEKEASIQALQAALEELNNNEAALNARRSYAAMLLPKLDAYAATPPEIVITVNWKLRAGIWTGGLGLAVLAALSGRNIGAYIAAVLVLGAAAFAGFKASIVETLTPQTPEQVSAFLARLAGEWQNACGYAMDATSIEAARSFFAQPAAAYEANYNVLLTREAELPVLNGGLAAAQAQLEADKAAVERQAEAAAAWLKDKGCASEEEYSKKVSDYALLAAQAADKENLIAVVCRQYGCGSEDELENRLFTEKEAFERKGADPALADEEKLARLKRKAEAAAGEIAAADKELGAVDKALAVASAAAGAHMEGLPEGINACQTLLAEQADELAGFELQKEAYAMAAGVFYKLAENSKAVFAALGNEVAGMMAAVLPAAKVEFNNFEPGEAAMADAAGHMRPLASLSSGTRDLFLLAARLAIAKKARAIEGGYAPALLVLDEPFYTLDQARTQAALALLAAFHKETNWQVIILTKDLYVAEEAARLGASEIAL